MCFGGRKWEKRNSIYSMWVTTVPKQIGRETPISFSENMGYLEFIIFCQGSDVSEMAVVSLKLPHTVITLLREPPERWERSIKA